MSVLVIQRLLRNSIYRLYMVALMSDFKEASDDSSQKIHTYKWVCIFNFIIAFI